VELPPVERLGGEILRSGRDFVREWRLVLEGA
jgi:hypothetical protein